LWQVPVDGRVDWLMVGLIWRLSGWQALADGRVDLANGRVDLAIAGLTLSMAGGASFLHADGALDIQGIGRSSCELAMGALDGPAHSPCLARRRCKNG
jgi:hypothetical protein